MSESSQVTQQESRGGDKVDWRNVVPGEPLPELPDAQYPETDSTAYPGLVPEDEWGVTDSDAEGNPG
jgi:hypothetical protein